jgi:hypothetical protein
MVTARVQCLVGALLQSCCLPLKAELHLPNQVWVQNIFLLARWIEVAYLDLPKPNLQALNPAQP